jgi:hypothetical protein
MNTSESKQKKESFLLQTAKQLKEIKRRPKKRNQSSKDDQKKRLTTKSVSDRKEPSSLLLNTNIGDRISKY